MSTDLEIRQTDADYYERYRALSTAAVASPIVGLLSCLARDRLCRSIRRYAA